MVIPIHLYEVPAISKFTAVPPTKRVDRPRPHIPNPVLEALSDSPELDQNSAAAVIAANPVTIPEPAALPELPPAPVIQSAQALHTMPPPSASYLLDVVRTEPNVANPYYGSGEIHWSHDGTSYNLRLEVGVDFLFAKVRLYSVDSAGSLGNAGIRPDTMTESRRGRSATATHFNYDAGTISFSASTATFPLSEGAQDRATVLMQLASIGNADPGQFEKGKEITIQVAEDKDASPFLFVVLNRETIDTRLGHLDTWHIVRPPRPGTYSSRLDIWVAPDLNWLPVQLRNTESNGAITTQTIRKIITEDRQ